MIVNTYLTLYTTETLGYDLITVGWLLSLRRIGDVVGQLPSGKIIERFGGEIILFIHVLFTAPTAYLFATSSNPIFTSIIMLIWGTELGWDPPSRRVLSVKYGEALGRATAMASVQSLITFSGILSPIVGGLLWSTFGSIYVFHASVVINIFASLPLLILAYRANINRKKL
jgi:predicted MFS family arabinose efflux permease